MPKRVLEGVPHVEGHQQSVPYIGPNETVGCRELVQPGQTGPRARVHDGPTTFYRAGALEVDWQSGVEVARRTLYSFAGSVVAQRNSTDGSVDYRHADALGSVALVTVVTSQTVPLSQQEYTPWGEGRGGHIPQRTLNYTGQRLDGTGLLYVHARYYDPALARWVSPDTRVPGRSASL